MTSAIRILALMAGTALVVSCSGDTLYTDPSAPGGGQPSGNRPTISISTASTSFSALQGSSDPNPQTVTILNSSTNASFALSLSVSYQSGSGWLNAALTANTTPTSLVLQPRVAGLAPGTYVARASVSSSAAANSPQVVIVTLTIQPPPDTRALVQVINDYRASLGLPRIPVSKSLTSVAEAHVRDLEQNSPAGGVCNGHSWSNKGNWTACCYTADHAHAECMWRKPREITGGVYQGSGYEIAFGGGPSGITPTQALAGCGAALRITR